MGAGGVGAGLQGVGTALNIGSSLYSGNMQAKAIKREANAQANQVLEEGRQTVQAQKSASSGAGYLTTPETSNFQLMLDTEQEARNQASLIKYYAKKQAKQAKTASYINAAASGLQGAGSIASKFK